MFPSIRSGDTVIIRPARVAEIGIGDIIVHRTGQRLVAHRLIKKKKVDGFLFFITKGDYLSSPDPPISASQLLGKVVSIERGSRIIQLDTSFQRHWSWVLALTSPWLHLLIKIAYSPMSVVKRIAMNPVRILRESAILKSPEAAISSVREKYSCSEEVSYFNEIVPQGLNPVEKKLVELFFIKKGRILVAGCGAGREAVALVREGFEVTGIDIVHSLVAKAKENAEKEGMAIDFEVRSVTEINYPEGCFDYVFLPAFVYTYIPGEGMRIETLKKIANVLKSGGIVALSAYNRRGIERGLNAWLKDICRRLGRAMIRGDFSLEPGDVLVRKVSPTSPPNPSRCFCHWGTIKEVSEEIRKAGLSLIEIVSWQELANEVKLTDEEQDKNPSLYFIAQRMCVRSNPENNPLT
jgi:2-polyprenyl-3-methyl-5-hydroxy-6-metoxy-1,4-benzoquinol methylase